MDFYYTKSFYGDSSVVSAVFYNENTNKAVVRLRDGSDYEYSNVPAEAYSEFAEAVSRGRHYANCFKRKYGPSVLIGRNTVGAKVPVPMPVSPDRANARSRSESYVTNNSYYGYGYGAPQQVATAGTPKDLKVTENTLINNVVSLTATESKTRKHVVHFEVDGNAKAHTLKVDSVDEAVDAVLEIADMLDLEFTIKKVEVFFE